MYGPISKLYPMMAAILYFPLIHSMHKSDMQYNQKNLSTKNVFKQWFHVCCLQQYCRCI